MPSTADLHQAIRSKDASSIKKLIRSGADINGTLRGTTPLSLAVYMGYEDLVEILLQHGANINNVSKDHNDRFEPPLYTACRLGMANVAKKLIKFSADVNKTDYYNQTPLWIATRERRLDLVQILIDHGAKMNAAKCWSECPLYLATKYLGYSGRREIALMLIRCGCEVNITDPEGRTPLFWAIKNCDKEIARLLVLSGAKVRRYSWLMRPNMPLDCREDETFCQWIHQEMVAPLPLRRICRTVIRKQMVKALSGSIAERIYLLPVPESIKEFIALETH